MSRTENNHTIGPYILHDVIGQGGMGCVYHAYQPSVERDVVIKVITAPFAGHPAFLQRFEIEARANARLQHPHILPIYDSGVDDGRPYLVMAFLPGGTLTRRIASRPGGIPLKEVVRVTAQMASALDYAHQAGVVHRDIKPDNVLFDMQGNAYLADFGIALFMQNVGRSAAKPVGTGAYMAPEVALGGGAGPASDIFSLGVLVFEMLTGRRPNENDDTQLSMSERGWLNPLDVRVWRPELPPGVGVVVQQALHAVPSARPPTAMAFAQTLAQAAGLSQPAYLDSLKALIERNNSTNEAIPTPPPDIDLADLPALPVHNTPPPDELGGSFDLKTKVHVPPSPSPVDKLSRTMPALLTAGLVILLVGLFVLLMLSLAHTPVY
ncbi:MAG: serine/threonine protein kinase [Anaerolineae bacterium]|nr:serine/threonine protein kinase [Anaerolineae bacterium]